MGVVDLLSQDPKITYLPVNPCTRKWDFRSKLTERHFRNLYFLVSVLFSWTTTLPLPLCLLFPSVPFPLLLCNKMEFKPKFKDKRR